jgi:hypothetical protein
LKDIDEINRLLRPLARIEPDEPGGRAGGTRAQTLLTAIIAQERDTPTTAVPPRRLRERRRARRTLLGLAASAVVALGAVLGPGLLGYGGTGASYANSAVEIHEEGDTYVARIKNPYADQRKFSEAFRALGFNIELNVVPVSPAAVGKIFKFGGRGATMIKVGVPFGAGTTPADCDLADSGCFLQVTVPAAIKDTPDVMHFELGRPAKPDESYADVMTSATRPGEQLAGVKVSGRTVGEVLAEVEKRGLTAEFSLVSVYDGGYELKPMADQADADWIVFRVTPVRAGVVRLAVTPEREPGLEYVED